MIRGIQVAGSALQPMLDRLEVIANNLANIHTTGFKRDSAFARVLQTAEGNRTRGNVEKFDSEQYTDFTEGSLTQTNNPLDFAIQGRGFFAVETPQGARFTRNGNFMLSVDGTVTTQNGYPVLGTNGRLQLPNLQRLAQGQIAVSQQGEITVDKQAVGALRVVSFDNLAGLKKEGNSIFSASGDARMLDLDKNLTAVRQGFLEESNVDGIEEMITMIELTRNFESSQRVIQQQDATLDKALEIGRL
jgi:flagellar basal-body rod protein FlgG